MKSIISSIIIFVAILSIAISYQLHLMNITQTFNTYAQEITNSISSNNFNDAENTISSLEQLWNNNSALLMVFHDHTVINNASTHVRLVKKTFNSEQYEDCISYLIYFTSLMNELAAENKPTFENIL